MFNPKTIHMKTALLIGSCLLLIVVSSNAQIKIGNNSNTINSNSLLEMESTSKGFLPPRVALNNLNLAAPLSGSVPEGMLVYSIGGTVTNGFYYWDGTQWQVISAKGTMGNLPYASVSSSTTQLVASTTTSKVITYETDEVLNLITHSTTVNPSRLTIQVNGTYLISVSAELSGGAADVNIWLRKNGIDVPRSNSVSHLFATDNRVVTLPFVVTAVANDYFELVQSSTNTNVGLTSTVAGTNPTRPVIPSVIVEVNKLSD